MKEPAAQLSLDDLTARPGGATGPAGPRLEPAELRDLLGVPFTDEQLAAATAPLEPGLIVAGAGSGKTSVMSARVVWLVVTGAVAPENVLGLTFTVKAAAELAERIRGGLARARRAGAMPDPATFGSAPAGSPAPGALAASDDAVGEPEVSTYHAFAHRLVTEYALYLGLEPDARMLADATRYQLAGRVLRAHQGRPRSLTKAFSSLIGDVVGLEAELSEHLVTPEELAAFDERWAGQLVAALAEAREAPRSKGVRETLATMLGAARARRELATIVAEYRAAKKALGRVDFGDLVSRAVALADQVGAAREIERARARVVLLDEYQDTSVAQRRMLAGLFGAGHPVTAVGDPCQAIYGWRGASVSNLDGFPRHFPRADGSEATVHELTVNQRSGGRLLILANTVAAPLRDRHRVAPLRPRPDVAAAGHTVVALHVTWADEVAWIADSLKAIIGGDPDGPGARAGLGPVSPGECAVLVRNRADVASLYAALGAAGLPVEVVGLGGLLSLPEVADVVATLALLVDPTANAALVRLLTGPRIRLGPRDLAALGRAARDAADGIQPGQPGQPGMPGQQGKRRRPVRPAGADPLDEAVAGVDPCDVVALSDVLDNPGDAVSPAGRARLAALAAELRLLRAHVGDPLLDVIHRVVEVSGLQVELAASPEALAARRGENLAAFLDVAAEFTDLDNDPSVSAFLAFLDAAREHERGLDATSPSGADRVQLMTVHKSKGLEWPVVVVPDLTRKVFPVAVVRGRWTTTAATLPSPLRGDAADLPVLGGQSRDDLAAFEDEARAHQEREERRLGYVAFTRAKTLLLGSGHWWGPSQKEPRGPSPFLTELRDHVRAGDADRTGHGAVAVWADEPERGATNPALAAVGELTWPLPYEPGPYARRRAAGADVERYAAELVAGQEPPADDPAGMTADERAMLAALDRDVGLLLAEARRLRGGVREVELPAELTASQLVVLRSDPAELARELARPMPRRPAPAARRGTAFHSWVEDLFGERPLIDLDELPGAADAVPDLGSDGGGDGGGDGDADGRASGGEGPAGAGGAHDLAALKEAFLATEFGTRRPVAVEAPFELVIGTRAVRGRIDAVYAAGPGRFDVVDWKTGRERADPVQLAVYRLAWARLAGVEPSAVGAAFLYVATGELVRPPLLDEAELAALLAAPAPDDNP